MTLLRRAIFMAARRMVSDPVVQAKARELARDEIAPRVGEAVERIQPAVAKEKEKAGSTVEGLREVAAETSPVEKPGAFLKAARERLRNDG